jgi:hypothetical protein
MENDRTLRVGVLGAYCILRDQALAGLAALDDAHNLVLESAAVASLKEAVEAGFCRAFLPVSISDGLIRSTSIKADSLNLTFPLITGPHFDPTIAERISDNFGQTLRD